MLCFASWLGLERGPAEQTALLVLSQSDLTVSNEHTVNQGQQAFRIYERNTMYPGNVIIFFIVVHVLS